MEAVVDVYDLGGVDDSVGVCQEICQIQEDCSVFLFSDSDSLCTLLHYSYLHSYLHGCLAVENLEGKNGILVSGGWTGTTGPGSENGTLYYTTTVDFYNVDTMAWEDWEPLPEGRGGHGMGYVGGLPAVMGGGEWGPQYRTDIAVYRGGRWEQIQNTLQKPIKKSLYTSTVTTNLFSCEEHL